VVVAVVVTTAVDVVDIGVVAAEVVVTIEVVDVFAKDVVGVFVVVAEPQDANTSDITIRQVNSIQMTPLFIRPPLFNLIFCNLPGIF
jgi:hypothetical protein